MEFAFDESKCQMKMEKTNYVNNNPRLVSPGPKLWDLRKFP